MYSDISGYAPEWLKTAGTIGAIVGAVLVVAAITVLTCGVGTATLAGAIAVGAAKGILIGAAIGAGVGASAGAIGSLMAGEEFGSSEFWSNTLYGGMAGFGIGVLAGGIYSGISAGTSFNSLMGKSFGKLGTVVKNPNISVNWSNVSDYAMNRMTTRGVTQSLVNSTVRNGVSLLQSSGRYLFLTRNAAVVTTATGTLVTTYGSAYFDSAMQEVIRIIFGG